jgi:hypothetical protein
MTIGDSPNNDPNTMTPALMPAFDADSDPAQLGKDTKPEIVLPDGYKNEGEFLGDMRNEFYEDIQVDRMNREAGIEDLQFLVGNQWDDLVRQRREAARKPCLTFNNLPAFVAQIIGNRRINETDIKIIPDNGGTKSVAHVREGLVRNIQKESRAELAYDTALLGEVACGIGQFKVELDYENDDVFEQAIRIKSITDHFSVVWDRTLTIGDGRDARHVFVVEVMPKKQFYAQWPWATPADVMIDTVLRGDLRANGWVALDDMRTKERVLALMDNGATIDITEDVDDPEKSDDILSHIVQRKDGSPIMRKVQVKYAQMYLCSGLDVLEGPYELPIDRVPVLRVPGWEVSVGEFKHRWGLVRHLKDPQRLHNFWRSVTAEKIMQTPRSIWLASSESVAGREKDFRNSHLSDDPLLIWNSDSGAKPERIAPAQIENALIGESEMTKQDLKDISNIHEANLGMPSNEVSGVAIQARQRVSDTGTVIYHDNLNKAIEEAGRIINQLIPTVYDTPRIIKVLGDDAKEDMVVINAQDDERSIDVTIGKYAVSVITGPSFATKRQEAGENMMALATAMPAVMAVSADLIVEAQDWPMADKIANRIRKTLPPGLLDPSEMTPEMQAGAAAQQQKAAGAEKQAMADAVAQFMKTQSETAMNFARARNFQATADAAPQKIQNESVEVASKASEREVSARLEAVKLAETPNGPVR